MPATVKCADYDVNLMYRQGDVYFQDLNDQDNSKYKINLEATNALMRRMELPFVEAAILFGVVEQTKAKNHVNKQKRTELDYDLLVRAFVQILICTSWERLYYKLKGLKMYQIQELCEAPIPLKYYIEEC